MANYGETLTYWYLRLNGFFPITNFVLHRTNDLDRHTIDLKRSADADLLAVRFRHVYERVGGQEDDWDEWFTNQGLDLEERVTGLIVEVKTGRFSKKDIEKSFGHERLRYAIERFGFYKDDNLIDRRANSLLRERSITTDYYRVAKLLVSNRREISSDYPACHNLTLSHIEVFIKNRMDKYSDRKSGDRFFFNDDLIQYFAWKAQN